MSVKDDSLLRFDLSLFRNVRRRKLDLITIGKARFLVVLAWRGEFTLAGLEVWASVVSPKANCCKSLRSQVARAGRLGAGLFH